MNLEYKIADEKGTRYDEQYKIFDMIKIDDLHKFAIDTVNKYGDTYKLDEANDVCDTLVQLLKHKGLLTDNAHQSFVDILLVAGLIHNLFYDEKDFTTLFKARQVLAGTIEGTQINDQIEEAIFATVEGQLGEKSPIAGIKPNPNTPTELFSLAVWMVKEYNC